MRNWSGREFRSGLGSATSRDARFSVSRGRFTPGSYRMRTFPQNVDGLRGPGYQQWNASLSRNIRIRERLTFQARLDALNVMNHSYIGSPNTTPTSAQFGQITAGAANLNRLIQIQGHLRW
jgi:hypothetical protein